jgi:phosphoglycolate phosphatase-like HAD superfamily hydrolase
MEIQKIYFDMDGVLADFDRGIRELCHMEPAANQAENSKAADDAMWEAVRAVGHFYDKLEPMPGALEMFEILHERYGDRCEILTGIPKPHRGILTSGEDKTNWAHRVLSDKLKVNVVLREEKKNYAKNRGYILIDDLERNINEWNEAGGTGIRFNGVEEVLKKLLEFAK